MTEISRVALFGKLNKLGYQAVESATVFCKMRGNPYVELVHWLHQLLAQQDSDIHRIIQHYDLDTGKIATELTRALDMLPRGASTISDLSDHLMDAMERGWVWGSLLYSSSQVRSGHLLLGMLKTPALRNILSSMSPELAKIGADDLADNFGEATDGSPEDRLGAQDGSDVTGGGAEPGEASGAMAPRCHGQGRGAGTVLHRSDRAGQEWRNRPDCGPRRGNPSDRRYSDAAAAEQPDPDR